MLHFHHRWVETGRMFTPPSDSTIEGRGPRAYDLACYAMVGCTTVSLRCSVCGDVRTRLLAGEQSGGSGTSDG